MRKTPAKQSSLIVRRGKMSFTAVFLKVPEGYIGFVEELPGANTQGATDDAGSSELFPVLSRLI